MSTTTATTDRGRAVVAAPSAGATGRAAEEVRRRRPERLAHQNARSPAPDRAEGVLVRQVVAEVGRDGVRPHLPEDPVDHQTLVPPGQPQLDPAVEVAPVEAPAEVERRPARLQQGADGRRAVGRKAAPVHRQPRGLQLDPRPQRLELRRERGGIGQRRPASTRKKYRKRSKERKKEKKSELN